MEPFAFIFIASVHLVLSYSSLFLALASVFNQLLRLGSALTTGGVLIGYKTSVAV